MTHVRRLQILGCRVVLCLLGGCVNLKLPRLPDLGFRVYRV